MSNPNKHREIESRVDAVGVKYIFAETHIAGKFCVIVFDVAANELVQRIDGPEELIYNKYRNACQKAGAV